MPAINSRLGALPANHFDWPERINQVGPIPSPIPIKMVRTGRDLSEPQLRPGLQQSWTGSGG